MTLPQSGTSVASSLKTTRADTNESQVQETEKTIIVIANIGISRTKPDVAFPAKDLDVTPRLKAVFCLSGSADCTRVDSSRFRLCAKLNQQNVLLQTAVSASCATSW